VERIKIHDGAVWVSNTDKGTLLRIPIGPHGTAGAATTVAQGLTAIDDFGIHRRRDTVIAALDYARGRPHPGRTARTRSCSRDRRDRKPTSIAVRARPCMWRAGRTSPAATRICLLAKLG